MYIRYSVANAFIGAWDYSFVLGYVYVLTFISFYSFQGLIARLDGNLNESLQYLQKALEINPSNPENLKEIGRTL